MVPTGFAHCFNGNCKSADHCLRHQIVRFIPDTHWSISVVNPACTNSDGDCKAFMADTPRAICRRHGSPVRPDSL
ncbi:MAG: DUF6078 family protein [Parabacteroides sp.]